MAEQGCIVLTAQHVTDGIVTVTPPTPPAMKGSADVRYERQRFDGLVAFCEPRKCAIGGDPNTLVITLAKQDRVGRQICWTNY